MRRPSRRLSHTGSAKPSNNTSSSASQPTPSLSPSSHCPPHSPPSPPLTAVPPSLLCSLQDNEYNTQVIKLCKYRHGLAQKTTDVSASSHPPLSHLPSPPSLPHLPPIPLFSQVSVIESTISCGQIEELIEQAEDEFDLVVAMNETIKPWEADPEGDEAFAEYHPSFGETLADYDLTLPNEAETFKEVDQQLGLRSGDSTAGAGKTAAESGTTVTGTSAARQ